MDFIMKLLKNPWFWVAVGAVVIVAIFINYSGNKFPWQQSDTSKTPVTQSVNSGGPANNIMVGSESPADAGVISQAPGNTAQPSQMT